jgi:capsular exopolysaccharide synthesis family protein
LRDNNLTSLSDFVHVLRRRWWIIVLMVAIAALSAYLYSKRQTPAYSAKAVVRLSAQPVSSTLTGVTYTPTSTAVTVANEAVSAEDATVIAPTLKALHLAGTTSSFLKHGSVSGDPTNALLSFSYEARTGPTAQHIANVWAEQYKLVADARDKQSVDRALDPLVKSKAKETALIHQLQLKGFTAEAQSEALVLKSINDRIVALQSLRGSVAGNREISPAIGTSLVRPQTRRNVIAGISLGLVLGLLLIGLIEALDTRIRQVDEVGSILGLPLLSRIPTPSRSTQKHGRLAMIDDNDQQYSEAYRKLRVNFDFANVRAGARIVMLTSALEQEGKSTTVANLAVALARAGRHVILVDLDLRAPSLHEFFSLGRGAGVTDLAVDRVAMDQVLHRIQIEGASGQLDVVPVGTVPSNPSDFLASPAVDAVLGALVERADVVLIDSAPLLPVSDSIALSSKVDGILVVVASGLKRHALTELQRALSACQAPSLGFILTGAEHDTDGYYGARYGYGGSSPTGGGDGFTQLPQDTRVADSRHAGGPVADRETV